MGIWIENYMLATGNRLSTALNVHIKDIDFDNGMIMLRKTKNRIPIGVNLSTVRYAHNALLTWKSKFQCKSKFHRDLNFADLTRNF